MSFPPSPPYPCGTFDRILLDAPCSALGQRPQFVVRMTLKELQSYPRLQRKLFTTVSDKNCSNLSVKYESYTLLALRLLCNTGNLFALVIGSVLRFLNLHVSFVFHTFFLQAVGLLKEGGVLVYSTCTITPQENEEQVAWALRSFPCLRLSKQVSV